MLVMKAYCPSTRRYQHQIMSLSSTTTSTQKPWALLFSIYVTQYIGLAFIFASSVAILRDMGMALNKIALLNLLALPLLLKILYAPFIDSIRPAIGCKRLQGRYRSWLIIAQFMMMGLLIAISLLDVNSQFNQVLILMLIYGFAVSIQDVAVDGLACKIFSENERQRANSLQFSGNLAGNIIGGGLILMVYPWLGWQGALLVLALLTAVVWVQLLSYKEPATSHSSDNTTHKKLGLLTSLKSLIKEMWRFITTNKAWFLLLLIYPIGFSTGFALINPLLVDAGWALADIGFVTKVFGSLIGVVSALSASVIIDKIGRVYTLLALTAIQAIVLLFILPLSLGYTSKLMVYGAVALYFLVNPALMATTATIAMDKASTHSAKATYFTLQLGAFSFMGFVYAGIAMSLVSTLGYSLVLIGSAVMTAVILLFMNLKRTMFVS